MSVQIALEAEVERLRHDIERHAEMACELATECERLRAELAACQQDAERYRWWRKYFEGNSRAVRTPAELDAAIDTARKGEAE